MSVCCIGGVCIPYTAIVPLLLLGFKWIASQLAAMGLLPPSIANHLGLQQAAANKSTDNACMTQSSVCCSNNTVKSRSVPSKVVHSVESMDEWTAVVEKHPVVVVKFTATWCRPCKEIAPVFEELSRNYPDLHFCQVDVDELDQVAAQHSVAVMPTFVVLQQGTLVSTLRGSNPQKLQDFVQQHVVKTD